jgi:hypothetical protein
MLQVVGEAIMAGLVRGVQTSANTRTGTIGFIAL